MVEEVGCDVDNIPANMFYEVSIEIEELTKLRRWLRAFWASFLTLIFSWGTWEVRVCAGVDIHYKASGGRVSSYTYHRESQARNHLDSINSRLLRMNVGEFYRDLNLGEPTERAVEAFWRSQL